MKRLRLLWLQLPLFTLLVGAGAAQQRDPNSPYPHPVLEFDAATLQVKQPLPFGESFFLKVPTPEGVDSIALGVTKEGRALGDCVRDDVLPVPRGVLKGNAIAFFVCPLDPKEDYDFKLTYYSNSPVGFANRGPTDTVNRITGRTEASLASHFLTDIGVLFTREAEYWGALTSLNFYAVPINYAPYVDLLFIDDEFAGLLNAEPLKSRSDWRAECTRINPERTS